MSLNKIGTRIEFYEEGKRLPFVTLTQVGAIPSVGDYVNIRKQVWEVTMLAWAVDHAGEIGETELRANVEVKKVK